jgi:hypothetical protein
MSGLPSDAVQGALPKVVCMAVALLSFFIAVHTHAQELRVVDDVVVNIGWVDAARAEQSPEHSAEHRAHVHRKGVYHLLVSLTDAQTGKSIEEATVVAVIDDPLDRVRRVALKKGKTGTYTDFSEYLELGPVGRYNIGLEIAIRGKPKVLKTSIQKDYAG